MVLIRAEEKKRGCWREGEEYDLKRQETITFKRKQLDLTERRVTKNKRKRKEGKQRGIGTSENWANYRHLVRPFPPAAPSLDILNGL